MKVSSGNRELLDSMISQVMANGGVAKITLPATLGPFFERTFAGKRRVAAEESLYTLPVEDPFYGYGELALLASKLTLPEPPPLTGRTPAETKIILNHWRSNETCTFEIFPTEEIRATNAMYLFRATKHEVHVPNGNITSFYSEKWRTKKNAKYPATVAAIELIHIARDVEVVGTDLIYKGLILKPTEGKVEFRHGGIADNEDLE